MNNITRSALNKRPWLVRVYLILIMPIASVVFVIACIHQYMINIWEGIRNATNWIMWESTDLLSIVYNSFKNGRLGK